MYLCVQSILVSFEPLASTQAVCFPAFISSLIVNLLYITSTWSEPGSVLGTGKAELEVLSITRSQKMSQRRGGEEAGWETLATLRVIRAPRGDSTDLITGGNRGTERLRASLRPHDE